MHRSRSLALKVLNSSSWCVVRNRICVTTRFNIQQSQIRGKKSSSRSTAQEEVNKASTQQRSAVSQLFIPPVSKPVVDEEVEVVDKLAKQDLEVILNKFYGRNEIKLLSAENGIDEYLFNQASTSFTKFCVESETLPEDLLVLFRDISKGSSHVDCLFTYFIKHAKDIFPHLKYMGAEQHGSVSEDKQTTLRTFTSTERNFITPLRAMQEYLLQPHELNGLRKTMRRSPHADEPPIMVYWRRDVEARANEIWGGKENIRKERRQRTVESTEYAEALFDVKAILKKYRREHKEPVSKEGKSTHRLSSLMEGSGRIVVTAVLINGTNFVIKLLAWYMTGSHSLFAEAIHSLADTINQIILAYGIHKSTQSANLDHPYGYANMRHVASLISGVGIFCVGAGLSFYHGITGLVGMAPVENLHWALFILAGSLVSEGATLFLACNAVRKRAKEVNLTFREFILRGRDPSLNVVILEDTAAVAGVGVAGTCMALTMYFQSPIPDAAGSLVIGGLLGGVASFIIYSNSAALVGRSIPRDNLEAINMELENDVMIRAIHDVKGIDMGNNMVRYKAEVDFDGRELTRAYIDKQDMAQLMEEVRAIKTTEELENFVLKHGENIVDTLGAEIDRIEKRLRKSHPEVRHCDLEIL